MKSAAPAAQRALPNRSITPGEGVAAPSPIARSRTQQVPPDLSYVRGDLIKVGLVSGITILIMIILWLVL